LQRHPVSMQHLQDALNLAQRYAGLYGSWTKSELFGLLAVAASGVFGLVKGVLWLRGVLRERHAGGAAEKEARGLARQSFSDFDIALARVNFVEQHCSVLDPSKEVNLRSTVSVQEPVLAVLKRELGAGQSRHILILADSGMGKTTLLLNLLARDLDLPARKRKGFVAVSLARDDALKRVSRIKSKSDKILLLDAFDEDAEAIENHRHRLSQIMKEARDFNAMIMTCRTQFFAHDEEIPREVGVLRISPRPAGQDQSFVFRKLYLLPYTKMQTKEYLHKAIPWWRASERRKASALALRIKDLAARPMLLALVPDLVRDGRDARELFNLYQFMVEKWFDREKSWMDRDTLRRASMLLAVDMVLKRHQRGAESIPPGELLGLLPALARPIERRKFEGRSLLNRDHASHLKFSHRSIMEYFFVLAVIEGQHEALAVEWTDQMRDFFFSWGRTTKRQVDIDAAREIFLRDSSASKILPVFVKRIDADPSADALALLLRVPSPRAVGAGFPQAWVHHTLSVVQSPSLWAVHERADGLAWDIPRVPVQSPAKALRYFDMDQVFGSVSEPVSTGETDNYPWRVVFPSGASAQDADATESVLPTLAEFTGLAAVLARLKKLHHILDRRERYWLLSSSRKVDFLVSVRRARDEAVDFSADRSSEQVCTVPCTVEGQEIVFALHRCTSPHTRAVMIRTRRLSATSVAVAA
jgi:hypothetical protein